MRRILLTGGTGFFGRALLRHWRGLGERGPAEVVVLARQPRDFLARYPEFQHLPWLRFHAGDMLHPSSLPQGQSFSHILHAAADSTHGPRLTPLQRYDQIVNGTRHMLDFAVACGAARFLLTSSGGVYGAQPTNMDRIAEDYCGMPDPLNAENAYGVAKRTAEHLCALYRHERGLDTVIARCFAFVGQDLPLDVHFAIGNFIQAALREDHITVGGDGTPVRSYLDQRDLAVWLLALLERGAPGRAYNVGSPEALTIAELAGLVRDIIAPDKSVRILGEARSQGARSRYVPDVSRAADELGLTVSIPLPEAIRHAARMAAGSDRGTA